jgi:hypothetical protein
MAKIIRKLITGISNQLKGKMSPSRRSLQVPISISFVPESNTGRLTVKREVFSIRGETKDLSTTGIAFLVDSIRLREYYLVGENRILDATLELPGAKIRMKILGQRYEQVGEHLSVNKYLIGATIENMNQLDREIYDEYLRNGNKLKRADSEIFNFEASKS